MDKAVHRSREVDAYIASQPPDTQRALEELRSCIWKAARGVSELMNYNIPAFALVSGGKRDKQLMIAGYSKLAFIQARTSSTHLPISSRRTSSPRDLFSFR
jgi:hypothetical protein